MFRYLLIGLMLLIPWASGATNTNTVPPSCVVADLGGPACTPAIQGTIVRVSDGATSSDCTTGAGSTVVTCQYSGSAWAASASSIFVGENGDTLTNGTDGQFLFTRDESGTVTITCADDNAVCALEILPGGAASFSLGGTSTTTTSILTDGLNLDIDVNGGTLSLRHIASGDVILGFQDYGDTTDDDMTHAIISSNCTTTSTGAEDCDLTISTTEAGTNEQRILLDGDGDIDFSGSDVKLLAAETATFGAPNTMTKTPAVLSQFVGIPKLGVTHMSTLTNGTTSTAVANPLLTNCNSIVNGAEADDSSNYITGSSSYRYTWAADVAADDGIDCVIAYPAVTDPISFGFWFRTDTTIASGDIDINFDDGGVTDGTISTLAVTVLNEWQWIEMDITAACSGECSAVDGIEFLATAQGAGAAVLDDAIINIDQLAMWKAADETAIGDIQVGGLIDFAYAPKAAGSANTLLEGVEWSTFFINYQTGADAIISITDLSAQYGTTLEALN